MARTTCDSQKKRFWEQLTIFWTLFDTFWKRHFEKSMVMTLFFGQTHNREYCEFWCNFLWGNWKIGFVLNQNSWSNFPYKNFQKFLHFGSDPPNLAFFESQLLKFNDGGCPNRNFWCKKMAHQIWPTFLNKMMMHDVFSKWHLLFLQTKRACTFFLDRTIPDSNNSHHSCF